MEASHMMTMKSAARSFVSGFRKLTKSGKGENPTARSEAARSERGLYRLWLWALPALLGLVLGWFGMVCLGVWLDGGNRQNRPLSASSAAFAATENSDMANMVAFLNSNPFKVTPLVLPDPEATTEGEEEEDAPPPITGSLATAVVRWTMPNTGVLLEDQGTQRVILLDQSFDVYTLEEVSYRQAIFRKGEESVVKNLVYSKEGVTVASALSPAPLPTPRTETGMQVIAADPLKGTPGVLDRTLVNQLMENPFEELRNVRIRPAEGEQGLQVQWINKDSILAQLGVQSGDVIRSINGICPPNMMDITNAMSSLMNNGSFDVEILRDGETVSLFLDRNPSKAPPDPTMEKGEGKEDAPLPATQSTNLERLVIPLNLGQELRNVRIRPAENGVLQVQWINEDSFFAQLGMRKGDMIHSINGIRFRNMVDVTNARSSLMNNDRLDIEMLRNGELVSLFLDGNPFKVTPMALLDPKMEEGEKGEDAPLPLMRSANSRPLMILDNPIIGIGGEICREFFNSWVENPYKELSRIRIRPAEGEQGLQVQWIDKDRFFAQLGVRRGDVIHSINGIYFRNATDLLDAISSLGNNDQVDIEILRNGESVHLRYVVR
jgi:type II secretory pathway component PulC